MASAGERGTERAALRALVRGRVQGVGFREFVRRNAVALQLVGWVKNLADGRSVELYAAGERSALQRLIERLQDGPRFARVDDVELDWQEPQGSDQGFEILL
jgi:acylphosphatase